ncbi:MAG: BatA domain-containing protein [bacterium]|jgi:hypothetical protein
MNFLSPLYLIAALAALVPLIIHLLHRQRARIQVFPSLEFLRKMMRKRTRRFQLKQLLLLLIRMLLILLIALALARPTITGGRAVKSHLPTTAVIILDDSFSMQRQEDGRRLFDLAVEKATGLLEFFDRKDEIYLLTGSSPTRNLTSTGAAGPARLGELLRELDCSGRPTDIAAPLRQAVAILSKSANPSRELYIISDMQKLGWAGLTEDLAGGENDGGDESTGDADGGDADESDAGGTNRDTGDIKIMAVDLATSEANACVKDIGFRIPAGSDDLEMEAGFEGFNLGEAQSRIVEIFLRDGLLERAVFNPGELGREKEAFRLPAFEGFLWGEVAMAEDALPIDDRRFFALPSRRRSVGIVGDGYYVATALSPGGGGGFRATRIEEGTVNSQSLGRLDILIADNVARFTPLEIEAISEFLRGGGSLMIFLGSRVDIGAYNRNLFPRIGGTRIEGVAEGGQAGFYTIDRVDHGHRIFAKFKPDQSPFGDTRFYQFMKTDPGEGRVLASFSDGSPAIVEAGDRVLIFTSSADIAWNDFALSSQFLPIVHEALLYLSSRAGLSQSYTVGEEIHTRVHGAAGEVTFEGPSGAVRHFPETLGRVTTYRIESPEEPGVYFLKTDRETLSVFAINVDTSESDLTKVAPDQVKSRLSGFEFRRITAADDIGESVSLLRQGRDLARILLWIALLLLILESLLGSSLWQRFRVDQDEDAFTYS